MFLLIPILLPVLAGVLVLALPVLHRRTPLRLVSGCVFVAELAAVLIADSSGVILTPALSLGDNLALMLSTDGMGKLFTLLVACIFAVVGFYAFSYLTHEEREWQFIGFYLLTEGALMLVGFAGSLVTFYMGYEMMTLFSLPLVLHERTPEAVAAAKKYLYYSSFGALCGLFGIFVLVPALTSAGFTAGGSLGGEVNGMTLAAVFVMLLGFGVKAGLFPLHGWLPTAHPVAPAPASAVLSGVITKAGVLGVIRTIYYTAGPETIRGSWVQWVYLALICVTIVMGSAMALREDVLKKRLAYSTVSQVSYILLGLALLDAQGLTGALTHIVFHSVIKNALFMIAGIFIVKTGCTRVSELTAMGRKMPVTVWCWVIVSLGLVGIPPMSGFVSKWQLMTGAMDSGMGVFTYLAPAALIVSALLTAGYLLPLGLRGFFCGRDVKTEYLEPDGWMLVPVVLLAGATVWMGIAPGGLVELGSSIVGMVL